MQTFKLFNKQILYFRVKSDTINWFKSTHLYQVCVFYPKVTPTGAYPGLIRTDSSQEISRTTNGRTAAGEYLSAESTTRAEYSINYYVILRVSNLSSQIQTHYDGVLRLQLFFMNVMHDRPVIFQLYGAFTRQFRNVFAPEFFATYQRW